MREFSPLLGQVFPGNAVSPSPASPLYCVFCLPPREPVVPAGLCEQGLGRSCWCGPSQAARMLISRSAALGLGRMWLAGRSSGPESWPADPGALGLSPIPPVAPLGLWVGQLASAPVVHPREVSGIGSHLRFQVWAPSPLIWVRTTGLQVSAGAAYPAFTVPGLRGEGRQKLRQLPRVL